MPERFAVDSARYLPDKHAIDHREGACSDFMPQMLERDNLTSLSPVIEADSPPPSVIWRNMTGA